MWLNLKQKFGPHGIEILIWSFGKGRKMSKIMQNAIFTLFGGVSMATANTQTYI